MGKNNISKNPVSLYKTCSSADICTGVNNKIKITGVVISGGGGKKEDTGNKKKKTCNTKHVIKSM